MSKQAESKSNSSVTIVDVAQHAGVSMKTVSRVINDEPSVRAGTKDRVLRSVEALGYQRNLFARGLRADKSMVLGLLYDNPQGDYPADVLHGALAYCREHRYHLIVEALESEDAVAETSRFVSQTRLDGVLLTPPVCDNEDVIKVLMDLDIPFIRISPRDRLPGEVFIAVDDEEAARQVVLYMAGLGHRKIGLIKGIETHRSTQDRFRGYLAGLEEVGIEVDLSLVVQGEFDFKSGIVGAQQLLERRDRPTAIFASNDETAAGVLAFAHKNDIAVPDDVSVCGFDGGTISRVVWPKLSTVFQPVRALGESAVKQLIALNDPRQTAATEPLILPFSLVKSESTGKRK